MGLSGSSLNNASPFQGILFYQIYCKFKASYFLFLELNCIQMLHNYKFYVIQLIKLLLIEKRVIFFSNIDSNRLCSDILCLLSVIPGSFFSVL